MAESSTFEKISNQILESADQFATRIEEGLSVILNGNLPSEDGSSSSSSSSNVPPNADIDEDIMMEMDEDMAGSPLEGIADGVLKDIMGKQVGPQTPMEHFDAFKSAIRWGEPFILGLIAFQIVIFLLCFWVSRKHSSTASRIVLMCFIGIVVRLSERLNGLGARNWEAFATQNYFDRQGVFVGIMFCAPLLMDCFFMLTMFIREASQLVVDVKRMELKKKRDANKKKGEVGGGKREKKSKSSKKKD